MSKDASMKRLVRHPAIDHAQIFFRVIESLPFEGVGPTQSFVASDFFDNVSATDFKQDDQLMYGEDISLRKFVSVRVNVSYEYDVVGSCILTFFQKVTHGKYVYYSISLCNRNPPDDRLHAAVEHTLRNMGQKGYVLTQKTAAYFFRLLSSNNNLEEHSLREVAVDNWSLFKDVSSSTSRRHVCERIA